MSAESEPNDAHEGIWLARPSAVPTDGISLAVKDLFDTAGLTTTYGSILLRRPRARPERRGGRPPRARRLPERRQDEPPRVRLRRHLAEPALRHGSQPDRARADRRRLQRWLGRRARRRARGRRARHRLRRLDPDPRRLLRDRRLQADVRPRPARRLLPARADLRPRRPDGPHGRRLHRDAGGPRPGVRARAAHAASPSVSPGPTAAPARRQTDPRGGGTARCPCRRLPAPRRHRQGVHARGRRRPPRPLRRERRQLRRQRPGEDRALPRGHRRGGGGGSRPAQRLSTGGGRRPGRARPPAHARPSPSSPRRFRTTSARSARR